MQSINITDVILNDRVRKTFKQEPIDDLADNILEKGLFHAILLRNDGKTLVAGERRLRAVIALYENGRIFTYNGKKVKAQHIPFVTLEDLSELQVREAELDENDLRQAIDFKERAAAISDLHKLRTEQAIEAGTTHHKKDTAAEVFGLDSNNQRITDVSNDLVIAEHLDDKDVQKAKNTKEALSVIKKKLEKAHREKLADNFNLEATGTLHTLLNADCRDILPTLEDETFDLIVGDPPYGIAADTFRNQSAVEHDYDDSKDYADEIMTTIAVEGFRITKPKAHAYIFCDILRFEHIKKTIFEPAGWYVWKWPLIWSKGATVGLLPRPDHGPRRTYEAILYAIKGDKKVYAVGPDVLIDPHERGVERGAHKPVGLYETLINRSCLPGNKIIDPTCGTGPILTAASRCNVFATAIEIDKAGFSQATERLKLGVENFDVPDPSEETEG